MILIAHTHTHTHTHTYTRTQTSFQCFLVDLHDPKQSIPRYAHPALNDFRYYMRIDCDSPHYEAPQFDPFTRMRERNLSFAYLRAAVDPPCVYKGLYEAVGDYFAGLGKLGATVDSFLFMCRLVLHTHIYIYCVQSLRTCHSDYMGILFFCKASHCDPS